MRLQTTERLEIQDPEEVLRVLESFLREGFTDVVRVHSEITVLGIGPSPITRNRRDTTVLRVMAEEGTTAVHADASFQASSMLGESPQDVVVRTKLEHIFEEVRQRLSVEGVRTVPAGLVEMPEAVGEVAGEAREPQQGEAEVSVGEEAVEGKSQPAVQEIPAVPPEMRQGEIESVAPHVEEVAAEPVVAESVVTEPSVGESNVAESSVGEPRVHSATEDVEDVLSPDATDLVEPVVAFEPAAKTPQAEVSGATGSEGLHLFESTLLAQKPSSRRGPAVATVVAAVLLALGAFFFHHRHAHAHVPAIIPVTATPVPSISSEAAPSAADGVSPPAAAASSASAAAAPEPSVAHATEPSDPKLWLEAWVEAMRGRDAVAQAGFYANTLDSYLGKLNVSNEDVLADKRASILNRRGLWTVKLEDITLNHQDADDISVHLVKHYMAETEPAAISEQFVRSRLQLKRMDGAWKIVSEQDLPGAVSPPAPSE